MKTKFIFLAVLTAIAVLFVSCSKDDDASTSPIVGTWVANLSGGNTETVIFSKKGTFRSVSTTGGATFSMSGVYTYNVYTGRLELTVDAEDDDYVYVMNFSAQISGKTMVLISESGVKTTYTKK